MLNERYQFCSAHGFDHSEDNLRIASGLYPTIAFEKIELMDTYGGEKFDLVCCFETLEHVGQPERAIDTLICAVTPGGTVLITVPIEVGLIGIVKFLAKMTFGYSMSEISDDRWVKSKYLWNLIFGKISKYRQRPRGSWGTHFGFDYRLIDSLLKDRGMRFRAHNHATTRFYEISIPIGAV